VIRQFEVYRVTLDPTVGSEVRKTRPCVVISPNEMNDGLRTVIVAPVTSTIRNLPFRVQCTLKGRAGSIMLDQIRTVDRNRLTSKMSMLPARTSQKVKAILLEMFE
jgi:mRNA interferase MazF